MIAYFNSSKVFFEKLNKLIVIENNNDEIINDIINKLNNSKEEIRFNLKSIIDERQ
jgi:cell fate regulator YaaT (PSP1 superfamily)